MGFMDKAKKMAEQAQRQAKDGTLKERAKALADQAQSKLDEAQGKFNDKQQEGAGAPPAGPVVQYDAHGRPIPAQDADQEPTVAVAQPVPAEAVEAVQEAAGAAPAAQDPVAEAPGPQAPAAPPIPASGQAGAVDRSHEAPPKVTGGDPLAG
jgi:hypothetical protein